MHGSLATRLRVLRAERGLTVREVAELSGVAKETISQVERGERHPYDRTLAKLAKVYEVPVEDLLEEPVPLVEAPRRTGQPEEVVRDPEEVVRDLAEVAQEVLPLIDELYEQDRRHSAQLDASEGRPQVFFVRAEEKIVDLFSDLHRDAAPQVLAMVGLYYRRKVAQLEENAKQRAAHEREGARR
jgi:transcriptional regulator with XRE-family HTH domain